MTTIGYHVEHQINPDGKIIALKKKHVTSLLYPEIRAEFNLLDNDGFMAFSANSKYFVLATFRRSEGDIVYMILLIRIYCPDHHIYKE